MLKKLHKVSGQNPIEAAKLGCKIYHGPYVYNFKEIYELLKSYKISEQIHSDKELSEKLDMTMFKLIKAAPRTPNTQQPIQTWNEILEMVNS